MKEEVVGVNEGQPIVVVKCDDSSNWVPIKSVNVETGTNTALGTIKREEDKKDYKRVDDMKLRYAFRSCLVAAVKAFDHWLISTKLLLKRLTKRI